jgi:energy-coupling factor transporter ATP-binding protein EcfA2
MSIKKLHVKNIGLFNSLNVTFNPKMNILIGANGSGKTSILRLITYCLSPNGLNHSRWRQQHEVWAESRWKESDYKSDLTIILDEGYQQIPFTNQHLRLLPGSRFNPVPNNVYVIGAYRYFGYKRIEGMKREAIGNERKKAYQDNATQLLDGGTPLPDIKQWMVNRYFSIDKEWSEIQRQNWEKIIGLLPKMAPQEIDFHFVRIERDLEPIFKLNGFDVYLEELSSGFKSFLAIVFSIIDWCEGVNDGSEALMQKAPGTVLIDEIDAHLHPQWQAKIIGHLKMLFPCVQFIVTTHSPHVIASAETNEVIKIPFHDGDLDLEPSNQSYQGWQLDFILEDVMNVIDYQPASIDNLMAKIENAYKNNDLKTYEANIAQLATVLHPNDPILKVYQLKKSNLILNQDKP